MTSISDSPEIQTPSSFLPASPTQDLKMNVIPQVYLDLFHEFEAYPFNDDPTFKAGLPTVLAAVRGAKRTAVEIDDMIGRAQWFYFTRMKGIDVPWDLYVQYLSGPQSNPSPSQSSSNPSSSSQTSRRNPQTTLGHLSEAQKMMNERTDGGLTFTTLANLIREGRAGEIEGIRDIPDELNTAPPSEAILQTRRKPWETTSTVQYATPGFDHTPQPAQIPVEDQLFTELIDIPSSPMH